MIIAACLPAVWPLISKFIPQWLLITQSSKKQLHRYDYHRSSHSANVGAGFSRLGNGSLEGIEGSSDLRMSLQKSHQQTDGTELVSSDFTRDRIAAVPQSGLV